jgi:aminoglycoside phosphotransferase (APT) family kinase protein
LGSPIVAAIDEAGGFSPGPACRVRGADGTRAFVKAVGSALNPDSPAMVRRELRLTAALPADARLPSLIDVYDDGDWVAGLFAEIDGCPPRTHPWDRDELDRVRAEIDALHDSLTPCPIPDVESVSERPGEDFDGWRTLAALEPGDARLARIDDWSRRHLDRLAELEARWADATAGDTLVHVDLRADNMLLCADTVVFVDWAHACRGAAWFDLVCFAPSVAMQGGPAPAEFLARAGRTARVDDDRLNAGIAAVAGYFTNAATLEPAPAIPTLRAFQAAQGMPAREWLRARTGWK